MGKLQNNNIEMQSCMMKKLPNGDYIYTDNFDEAVEMSIFVKRYDHSTGEIDMLEDFDFAIGDTDAQNAKIAELEAKYGISCEPY